ncbi:Rv0340 family IniB-related protein [Mycobacterium sp. 4D054]|uniref:Rv0340 family IniB-related protein n=1 Tax=unclassified Mycobacterium TaxID=2642494 RepID=UPI0021B3822C|nr:Rv0340 family IniB-related protein [Mycobacterium sp. SMC-8]UXA14120.1 Rv0340 family protein [Mycobacterium sp. SMC-8]
MPNALLDFVMTLVRDPDAAARYAADPAQALADADLTGVTSADVQNLIPVVAESMSTTAPFYGVDAFAAAPVDNVWASGAATAAFDAFDLPDESLPERAVIDAGEATPETVDLLEVPTAVPVDDLVVDDGLNDGIDPTVLPSEHWIESPAAFDGPDADDHASGIDLFD